MESPVALVEIASAMRSIVSEGQIVELRALKVPCGDGIRRTFSGYFDNVDVMAQAAAALTQKGASGVYFTPNPVKKSVKTTRLNEVGPCSRGEQAHDVDIQEVKWILIDIDPERPAGMSATAEEKAEAERVCKNVLEVLTTRGWPDPLMGDSGNGFHLMYRVEDVPSSTIREALDTLAFLCNEDGAKVVQLVFNPSRIWKVYGTWARHSLANLNHGRGKAVAGYSTFAHGIPRTPIGVPTSSSSITGRLQPVACMLTAKATRQIKLASISAGSACKSWSAFHLNPRRPVLRRARLRLRWLTRISPISVTLSGWYVCSKGISYIVPRMGCGISLMTVGGSAIWTGEYTGWQKPP